MEEDADAYLKLPIDERCVHKLWKARMSGYEEAIKKFPTWDGDDQNWRKFHGLVKKFITDTNAIAQEKGLEAALAYIENCDAAGRVVGDVIEGVVTKCVGAPKAKTKEKANDIVLMCVEIEQQEKVIEELVKGLAQKNPKVVSGCVTNLTSTLRAFGAKVIKVSPLLKAVVPLLDHRDKTVREEGKQLIIESYRWIGDLMKQQLSGLKPVQITELEAEFEKLEATKPKPERLLRSQQAAGGAAGDAADGEGGGEGGGGGGGGEDDEDAGDDDPYDLMDPVDILEKLPKNFYELVEEKKWQLRGEALDALAELVKTPKIASGDFAELTRVLKKFIAKDSNVMLVTKAALCTAGLAKGLRMGFKNGAAHILPAVLEKFKEKKPNVVAALQEAADGLYSCIGIENIQEDCLANLKHKTPTVVTETAKFLARCFAKCPGALVTNKKMVKGYVSALVESLNHSDPKVRDGASEALGVLMKVLGEPAIMKLMPDVEAIKVTKIKEFMEKAELTGKLPKAAPAAPAPAKATDTEAPRAKVVKPKGAKTAKAGGGGPPRAGAKTSSSAPGSASSSSTNGAASSSAAAAAPAASAGGSRKPSAKAKPAAAAPSTKSKKGEEDLSPCYVANDLKKTRFKDETRLKVLKWNFSQPRAEFVDQLKEQIEVANFNVSLQTQMFHHDFKQHLEVIKTLAKHTEADVPGLISNLDLILKWVTLRFFETNPAVLIKSLEYLNEVFGVLAANGYNMHDLEASSFVPYLVNKVGDPKDQVRNSIKSMFKNMYQVYPASKFAPFLMDGIKHKNAKLRTECLDELGWLIRHHGMSILQTPAACLKEMAKSISDRDNSVRNGAINAIIEAYYQVGEGMYKMVGNLPEKDMAMLEERIKRVSKTRGLPAVMGGPGGGANGPAAASAPPPSSASNGQPSLQPPQAAQPPTAAVAPSMASDRPNSSGIPSSRLPSASGGGAPGGVAAPSRIRNFRQLPVPGGGPPLNIPPPAAAASGIPDPSSSSGIPSQLRKSPGHGGGRDRPVSGAFTLDISKIESGEESDTDHTSAVFSRLVNNDRTMDELFRAPVVLPATSVRRPAAVNAGPPSSSFPAHQNGHQQQPNSLSSPPGHNSNDAQQLQSSNGGQLANSAEAKEVLDVVLAQVFSPNVDSCVSALRQLEELIKDEDKVVLMADRVDQLLMACYMQYRNTLNNRMRDFDATNSRDVIKLFQNVTVLLMSMYHRQDLPRSASVSALYDLLQVIINILLEPKLQNLPGGEGSGLLRALNVLTVKILDRSDPTNVTSAFVKLLYDVVGNSASPKAVELVMKCLWKVIRQIPKWVEEDSVDLDVILGELHVFLKKFPSAYWKKQELDTPMRTVKTIMHTLVKAKGDAVLDNLTKVPDPQNSELVPYLRKLLNSGVGGKENVGENNGGAANNGGGGGGGIPRPVGVSSGGSASSSSSSRLPTRISKSDHDQLAEIFRKIGDKEQTKQGLQELKNFKQQCPHADLEPFLSRSSAYFRKYIERGLASIEATEATNYNQQRDQANSILSEARGELASQNSLNSLAMASDSTSTSNNQQFSSAAFMNKLKMLREKAGLESAAAVTSSSMGVTSSSESSSSHMYRISSFSSSSGNTATSSGVAGMDDYSTATSGSTTSSNTLVEEESRSSSSAFSSAAVTATTGGSSAAAAANMDDIRRRFERVKNSAF